MMMSHIQTCLLLWAAGLRHVAHRGDPFPAAPKACFSKAFFENAVLLKKSPLLHFASWKKKKMEKYFKTPKYL